MTQGKGHEPVAIAVDVQGGDLIVTPAGRRFRVLDEDSWIYWKMICETRATAEGKVHFERLLDLYEELYGEEFDIQAIEERRGEPRRKFEDYLNGKE